MSRILIVDDDIKICALLSDYFIAGAYQVVCLTDGRSALAYIRAHPVDLVVLDLMLPELDGLAVCKAVRAFSEVPIIMLTARVSEIDRLLGLEMGADDYVCKPFSPREVVARAKVHLRRSGAASSSAPAAPFLVDRASMRILQAGLALTLTPVEFRLLAELIEHPDRVYSRQQLLDLLHSDQRDLSDRNIDTHIKNIRRKLDAKLPHANCLQSVYGVGYRFEAPGGA